MLRNFYRFYNTTFCSSCIASYYTGVSGVYTHNACHIGRDLSIIFFRNHWKNRFVKKYKNIVFIIQLERSTPCTRRIIHNNIRRYILLLCVCVCGNWRKICVYAKLFYLLFLPCRCRTEKNNNNKILNIDWNGRRLWWWWVPISYNLRRSTILFSVDSQHPIAIIIIIYHLIA